MFLKGLAFCLNLYVYIRIEKGVSMARIDKSESNIYNLPKGANVLKSGAVYINDHNYTVEAKEGKKAYVSHVKLCIGKICENDRTKFYANDNYKRKFLNAGPPEKADCKGKDIDEDAVGKCGFYCPSCPSFAAGSCSGCMNGNKDGDCYTRDCVLGKGISFCGQCDDFPCDVILTKLRTTVLDRDWLKWKKEEKLSQK
jgi:hypothetical protein